MASTPKTSNNNTEDSNNNSKVNIMSQYQGYGQCIDPMSPQTKSGSYDPFHEFLDILTGNDLFTAENTIYDSTYDSTYDFSPDLASSLTSSITTTPSLVFDGISTQDLIDSPLFPQQSSFSASPSLEPAGDFFPDLSDPNDLSSFTPALNIPWNTEATIPPSSSTITSTHTHIAPPSSTASSTVSSMASSMASSTHIPSSSSSSSTVSSTTSSNYITTSPETSKPTATRTRTRRKRSISELERDPQTVADELALKRAKNTDAARRSRQRKLVRMNDLENTVGNLQTENIDLQKRIAVLESEKKGLEDMNAEKDSRIMKLEQQLAEAHERLIKRCS